MKRNRKKKKSRLKNISRTMGILLDAIGEELYWTSPRGMTYAMFYGGRERGAEKRVRREMLERRRAIYELQRRKLATMTRKGDRLYVTITEKGFYTALRCRLKTAAPCPSGEYIIVTFDIPESQKAVRQQLRRLLIFNNFQLLHKSVWYTDQDVLEFLKQWVKRAKADPWVYIFRAQGVDIKKK